MYVNADQVLAPSAEAETRHEHFWREDVMRPGATEQVLVSSENSAVRTRNVISQLRSEAGLRSFRFFMTFATKGEVMARTNAL